ncbi:CAP domain-containing protein [Nonomuraea sp. B12E4]|uniref:CAP domain-containing protein n=1 Tax=Nonomuraea sp. B12E4 TaxID=3153564 RepID=UPI00325D33F7
MRRPLGVLAAVASLTACSPYVGGTQGAAAGAASEVTPPAGAAPVPASTLTTTPTPTKKAMPESDACRVRVDRPDISARRIRTAAVRRGCVRPALLRVRVKRAVPGDDPVVKSGATRRGRIALKLPCEPGTYYAVATDYRGGTARSKAVRLTCVTPTPTPSPTPTSQETDASRAPEGKASATSVGTALENQVVRLTNAERAKGGCGPLKHDSRLRRAAFGHSADMAENDYFDHDSQDGRDMVDRIRATGFDGSSWAENIAMGQRSAAEVVEGWMNSDGHRQNIMNCSYTLIGVGAAKDSQGQIYWTQDFAAR